MPSFAAMKRACLTILCLVACDRGEPASAAPTTNATSSGVTASGVSPSGVTPTAAAPDAIDTSCEPEALGEGRPDRVPFEQDGRWGFKAADGKIVIAAQYFMVSPYTKGGVAGVIGEGGPAFIDLDGRRLATALLFDNGPDYFVQGLARVVDGGKTGFIDGSGKIVVAPQFDAAGSFCDGLAPVCMGCKEIRKGEHTEVVGGQWGFVDRTGAVVIPIAYDTADGFIEGTARVGKGGRAFRIDRKGKELAVGDLPVRE